MLDFFKKSKGEVENYTLFLNFPKYTMNVWHIDETANAKTMYQADQVIPNSGAHKLYP